MAEVIDKPKAVKMKWSNREKDWEVVYPDRNGRKIGRAFCEMITEFEKLMSTDWAGKPTGFKDFRRYLIDGGYDPDTLVFSVKQLKQE